MSHQRWLRILNPALLTYAYHRQDKRRGPLRISAHRPGMEVLEDRITPSFVWDGGYSSAPPSGVVWAPSLPHVANFTSDDIPDQISANPLLAQVLVHPGRGDGTVGEPIVSSPAFGGASGVADLNSDGRLDVFEASHSVGYVGNGDLGNVLMGNVLTNSGDGSFSSYVFPIDDVTGVFVIPTAIGTVDVNRDGSTDVVVALTNENYDAFFVVLRTGSPPPPPTSPHLSIDPATITEGNAGAASATFTVRLSAPGSQAITVNYATADGTATAGDYRAASGTLTFAPGEVSKPVTVRVNGDRRAEPSETFVVNLSNPTNATIVEGQATGTILDDEPRISITDVAKREGKQGQTTLFTFTVVLSAPYDQPVTVSFRTVNGTATTGDNDYIARTGTLTFAPGETTKTITIQVKGDSKRESNESFYLDLFGNSSNSWLSKRRGLGTILNDD